MDKVGSVDLLCKNLRFFFVIANGPIPVSKKEQRRNKKGTKQKQEPTKSEEKKINQSRIRAQAHEP
jgi:hypothetical protein